MKRFVLGIFFTVGAVLSAFADDDIALTVSAPRVVAVGERFKVEFTINAKSKDIEFPFLDDFQVLAGPMPSTFSSRTVMNGEVTRQEVTTFTYILQAPQAGIFTLPPAAVSIKGKTYSSKTLAIEVVADGSAGASNNAAGGTSAASGQATQTGSASATDASGISQDDIVLRAVVDKTNLYKGEPVKVTLKLYYRTQISRVDNFRPPAYNGFWREDLDSGTQATQRERLGDKVYDSSVIYEVLLYPQQAGTLTIDPFELEVISFVQTNRGRRTIFDEMMGAGIDEVSRKITSKPVKLEVRELPAGAPESFNGAVGQFSMDAVQPPANINANAANTYTVKISGSGNLPLVRAPKIDFPTTFEQYNIKTTESFRHTSSGTTGYRQFEYPFIARAEGTYTIPELRFTYFDPKRSQYVTLTAAELTVNVAADSTVTATGGGGGLVSGMTKEDLKILGHDIRYIKMTYPRLKPKGHLFIFSPLYFVLMAAAVAAFIVALMLLKRYIANMQNDTFMKGKRANKVALKRLRNAETAMKQDDKAGFYDEMLKALWGYMSDKLNIPMARLTKDMIREVLFERNVREAQASDYVKIITACEEAQYSPTSSAHMNELYREAVNLISDIESAIKKDK